MKNNLIIRKAVPTDAKYINDIFYKTWLDTYINKEHNITESDIKEFFKDINTPERLQSRINNIINLPEHSKLFISELDNKVVGVCQITTREDFNQLQLIYILPEYQNKGIGSRLWSECLKHFNPNIKTIVQSAIYNKKAIKFYEKLGFVDNGKRFTEERHRMPITKSLIPEMEMEKPPLLTK